MNKKVIIAAVAILILLGIGGWYMMSRKSAPSATSTSPQNALVPSESAPSSIKDLLTKGIAQSCTYSTDGGSGKVYVAGGKIRGDFDTTTEGKVMKSHMIIKDNTSYIWTEDQKTGFKMTFDPTTVAGNTGTGAPTSTQGGIDPAADYNYKCGVWIEDSSQFDLPKGVTFTAFTTPSITGTAAPGQPKAATGSGSSQQCAYCNALSGDDKTQCLKALNCN